ncbi:MAG: hypothetical protein Q9159_000956 [Coniocarpon cinnabarinum]
MEALGTFAAVAQLLESSIKALACLRRFRAVCDNFQQHQEHLQTLISVEHFLHQSPLFRTDLIIAAFNSLLRRVRALVQRLQQYSSDPSASFLHRTRTKLAASRAEPKILTQLQGLEGEKSSLLILIATVQGINVSEALQRIEAIKMPDQSQDGKDANTTGTLKTPVTDSTASKGKTLIHALGRATAVPQPGQTLRGTSSVPNDAMELIFHSNKALEGGNVINDGHVPDATSRPFRVMYQGNDAVSKHSFVYSGSRGLDLGKVFFAHKYHQR